jgi:hypothetical protein
MVLFSLLFFSGLGSQWNDRIPLRLSLPALVILVLIVPVLLPRLFAWTLGLPLIIRFGLTALFLSPVGFLMGIPFPAGIRLMKGEQVADIALDFSKRPGNEAQEASIPWIWAVNGATSVVSSILAALLTLTFGFDWVLRMGAVGYAAAWLMVWSLAQPHAVQHQSR